MIQKINEISDVWRFINQLSDSRIGFLNSDKVLCIYEGRIKEKLLENRVEIAEEWRGGYLINETHFYSKGKLEPLFVENIYKILIVDNEQLLVKFIDYEEEEIKYGLFDFSLKSIKWLPDFVGARPRMLLKQRNLILSNDKAIKSYSIIESNFWQQSFTDITDTEKAILHSQILHGHDKLFFVLTGFEDKGLYVLDVATGKLLKHFKGLAYELFQEGNYIYTTRFQNILCRVNAQTLEVEEWNCHELLAKHEIRSIHDHRCAAKEGKFYFTQSIGDTKAKMGILDWESKELIYQHDFEPKNGAIGSIQVGVGRFFVHTQDNTLHIFVEE